MTRCSIRSRGKTPRPSSPARTTCSGWRMLNTSERGRRGGSGRRRTASGFRAGRPASGAGRRRRGGRRLIVQAHPCDRLPSRSRPAPRRWGRAEHGPQPHRVGGEEQTVGPPRPHWYLHKWSRGDPSLSVPKLLFGHGRRRNSVSRPVEEPDAKRSFAEGVPKQEFGNEGKSATPELV